MWKFIVLCVFFLCIFTIHAAVPLSNVTFVIWQKFEPDKDETSDSIGAPALVAPTNTSALEPVYLDYEWNHSRSGFVPIPAINHKDHPASAPGGWPVSGTSSASNDHHRLGDNGDHNNSSGIIQIEIIDDGKQLHFHPIGENSFGLWEEFIRSRARLVRNNSEVEFGGFSALTNVLLLIGYVLK